MSNRTQTYVYAAYDRRGNLEEGKIEGHSIENARDTLYNRGLTCFEVREVKSSKGTRWKHGGPSRRDVATFTREFAILAASGIPLDDALRIVADQPSLGRMRPIVSDLLAAVLGGAALSDALTRHAEVFQPDYINMARAGEVGSERTRVFADLADLLERRQELVEKTTSALVYPIILVIMALGSIGVVVGVLVPNLAPIFAESGRPMPTAIAVVIGIEQVWPELFGSFVALILATLFGCVMIARSKSARLFIDSMTLRLPFAGKLAVEQNYARFARTLGFLLRSGVPMLSAFSAACSVVRNRAMLAGLEQAGSAIRSGESLSRALAKRPGVPAVGLRMISVGQETAQLDAMLIRSAVMLEQQNQRRIERSMALLTPSLTVLIAGLVGALIMTVMNTVLSVNDLAVR